MLFVKPRGMLSQVPHGNATPQTVAAKGQFLSKWLENNELESGEGKMYKPLKYLAQKTD